MQVRLGALPGRYQDGTTFSQVLAWNHYGTETIPPRPVLRMAAERTAQRNKKRIRAFLHNYVEYAARGRKADLKDIEYKLLQSLGSQAAAEAKRIIEAVGQLRRNAPATVAKKGFNKPLFETGELEKKLSYEVVE